jgi:formate dehydrogenase major subunit
MLIHNHHYLSGTPVEVVTTHADTLLQYKVNETLVVKDYYAFVKSLNHFLVSNTHQNQLFINDNCSGYDEYKAALLKEDYAKLVQQSGVSKEQLEAFAIRYNEEMNAILFYSEKELGSNTCREIRNLALVTGKLGKTSNGLVTLKEKNNAQGLEDMGVASRYGIGQQDLFDESFASRLKEAWKVNELPAKLESCRYEFVKEGKVKNFFIFGEDPMGCAVNPDDVKAWFEKADFVMVQDYFMSETAKLADLILPAAFPAEMGGSFTNTQKMIQDFEATMPAKIEQDNIAQLIALLRVCGSNGLADINDIRSEFFGLLPTEVKTKHEFVYTDKDNANRLFRHGCDVLGKIFDEEFEKAF